MSIDNSGWIVRCKSCRNTFMYRGEEDMTCPFCMCVFKFEKHKLFDANEHSIKSMTRDEDTLVINCISISDDSPLYKDALDNDGNLVKGFKLLDYTYYNVKCYDIVVPLRLLSINAVPGLLGFYLEFTGSEENMNTLATSYVKHQKRITDFFEKKFILPE